jgi:hypothetical protein
MEKREQCLLDECKREQKKNKKYCGYHKYLEGKKIEKVEESTLDKQ